MIYAHFDKNSFWGSAIQEAMEIENTLTSTIVMRFIRKRSLTERKEVLIKSIGEMIGEKYPTAVNWVAKPNPFREGVLVEIRE
ncbi:hypothetical protein OFDDKENP_00149 [Aeromonas phage B614]|nr:hypothetical protein OFDDKENP_00149 [Aeromonas phage B614]UYD58123.1 hypothetical protein JNEOFJEA_00026 [Aeromonas phage UP87]UYD58487.1 hypothetical protein IPAKJDPM_00144 [Aeromonas phage avDM14-QBC]UYD58703.1 hypothetical protein HNNIDBEH_00110 [Aeromonas phage avDM10-HWA]UYD58994.1 hypothetical protein OFOPOMKI_00144 [Aeromonas phage avDM7-IJDJ]UYD59806.1 hypothetical protein LEHPIFIF_00033 [Aeromonas phage avDM9-HANS]